MIGGLGNFNTIAQSSMAPIHRVDDQDGHTCVGSRDVNTSIYIALNIIKPLERASYTSTFAIVYNVDLGFCKLRCMDETLFSQCNFNPQMKHVTSPRNVHDLGRFTGLVLQGDLYGMIILICNSINLLHNKIQCYYMIDMGHSVKVF